MSKPPTDCLTYFPIILPPSLFVNCFVLVAPTSVIYKDKTSINSKCIHVLLYGLDVCPLNRADLQPLDFCVDRLLIRLFCTNNLSMIEECRHYFNIALPSELLRKRTVKFLRKLNDHRAYG